MSNPGFHFQSAIMWKLCLGMALGLIAGCQGSKSPAEPQKTEATQATVPTKEAMPTPVSHNDAASPEATLRQMVEGLRQNRPEVIWQAMPRRFRGDINGLVHDFAGKMDPELWSRSFATWKKLARVLAEKKPFILSHPSLAKLSAEQRLRLEQNWDGLVELLTILVGSDLSDPSRLQSFDTGRFLKQTGGRWLSQLAALSESLGQDSLSGMLAGLTPKTLSVDKDKAKMAWMTAGSPEPVSTFSLIKVEGGWIPAGWGTAWEQIRAYRAKLRELPAEAFQQQSQQKLEALARVDQTLDALLAANTAEEFQQTLAEELGEPTVGELAALIRTLSGTPAPIRPIPPASGTPPKSATDANSITLLVHGAAGTEDEDRIFDVLQAALPGDVDVQFDPIQGGLKVIVGPVADLEAFRKRISFGSVTKVEADQRTLHIDMKR